MAVGWGVAGVATGRPAALRQAAIFAAIGIAPDLDLLIDRHSLETHSLGAAVIAASVAAWQRWPVASSRVTIWCAVLVAWLSHPLCDAISVDTSPPLGVMAFWPFTADDVYTGLNVFGPISRRYWSDDFWWINLTSLAREVAILLPVAVGSWWFNRMYRTRDLTFSPGGLRPPFAAAGDTDGISDPPDLGAGPP